MRKRTSTAPPAAPLETHPTPPAERTAAVAKFPPAVVVHTLDSWKRAKRRGPGRPRIGKGAKRVLVTVERGLLEQADAYARRHHVTRSHLICDALRAIMTSEHKHRPHTPNAA